MLEATQITNVRFAAASAREVKFGLLGWISCRLGGLLLSGITLRPTADNRLALSFPARRDSSGRRYFYIRPLDDRARLEIEHEVFAALGLTESSLSALEKM